MKTALELNETECRVLIASLNQTIQRLQAERAINAKYWGPIEEGALAYKIKLRDMILDFSYRLAAIDEVHRRKGN